MFKIGLSTTGKEICPSLFESYKKAGIDAMEISKPYEIQLEMDFPLIRKWADEYGVDLWSYHLPFKPFDLFDMSSPDKATRDKAVALMSEFIKKAGDIGIDKYVIHSGGIFKRNITSPEVIDARLKYAAESYARFAEVAAKVGGIVAVENLSPLYVGATHQEFEVLLSLDSRLRVCFDANHILPASVEAPGNFIRTFGDKIITVHISDYDHINERHWLPGEGKNDWQDILSALKEVGYTGPWLYEIGFDCPKTIQRPRKLTCEDFVRNANEIFENKKITTFCTYIQNL